MVFRLRTSGYFYHDPTECERLKKLGFSFRLSNFMGFTIYGEPKIEINTVEELVKFAKEHGDIIVSANGREIEIYNNYRE